MKYKTLGIGSLPSSLSEKEALKFSSSFDIPFYPHLLRLDGNMIDQVRNQSFKLLKDFQRSTTNFEIIKVQIAGPITTNIESVRRSLDVIRELGKKTIIFFDEPVLKESKELKELINTCRSNFYQVGIHCCNKEIDSSLINDLDPDIFSYDFLINPNLHKELNSSIDLCLGVVDGNNSFYNVEIKHVDKCRYISPTCGLNTISRSLEEIKKDLDSFNLPVP